MTGPAERVETEFAETFGGKPDGRWWAPGRVNLIGEHTDYNDGFVLPLALEPGVAAAARVAEQPVLRVRSAQKGETVELPLAAIAPGAVDGWSAYVSGVGWALREAGHDVPGLDVVVDGDIPVGAGLSSSAALECAVAVAWNDLGGLDLSLDALAAAARRAENDVVGAPTGVMDQMASLYGAGRELWSSSTRGRCRVEPVPFDPPSAGLALLVIDSKAPHALVDGEYAERRRSCERAVQILGVRALRDVTVDGLDAALARLGDGAEGDLLRKRVRHVVTENARVLDVVGALRSAGRPAGDRPCAHGVARVDARRLRDHRAGGRHRGGGGPGGRRPRRADDGRRVRRMRARAGRGGRGRAGGAGCGGRVREGRFPGPVDVRGDGERRRPQTVTVLGGPVSARDLLHLRVAGVSLVLDVRDGLLPAVLHWGHDLGDVSSADLAAFAVAAVPGTVQNDLDDPARAVALLPEHAAGWNGRPGLTGSRSGQGWSPRFTLTGFDVSADNRVIATGADDVAGLTVEIEIELLPSGLVRQRATVTSTAEDPYGLEGLRLTLPVPPVATELFDLAGRWGRERSPQRLPFVVGVHSRENRRGRTGPDAPLILAAGTAGFRHAQRRGLGRARGVEREPHLLRRAALRRRGRAGRGRAAAARRGRARQRARATRLRGCTARTDSASTRSRPASIPTCGPARSTRAARVRS